MRFLFRKPWLYVTGAIGAILLAPVVLILLLRFVNPPTTMFMQHVKHELRENNASAQIHHHWTPIDHMAACMPLAAVASEDQTFPSNHGFAWSSIQRAIAHNANGGRLRGASTITQQTAKNLFLTPAKSYLRKGIEAYLTLWVDLLWPKRRVLEVYLNVAQFGDNEFGVQSAAARLFDSSASGLSRSQCAALAAVLPAPDRYDAAHPGPFVRQRQAWILQQMQQLGTGYLHDVLEQN